MPSKWEPIYDISPLFWGALIVLAIFISCFLAWKLIDWLRNGRKSDGRPVNGGRTEPRSGHMEPRQEPTGSWDQAISRPSDCMYGSYSYGSGRGDLGGMTHREQEEFFSIYGPRKVRKAMKDSRRASQQLGKGPTNDSH